MMAAMLLALGLAAADPGVGSTAVPADFNPRALELFEAERVLMQWALRDHDANRDGWLSLYEAQDAAKAFRRLADRNADGRVTVREYDDSLDYIRLRYALD